MYLIIFILHSLFLCSRSLTHSSNTHILHINYNKPQNP